MSSVRALELDDDSRYATLLDVASLVVDHRDMAGLLPALAERLNQFIPIDLVVLFLYDPARDGLRPHIWNRGKPSDTSLDLGLVNSTSGRSLDESAAGCVARSRHRRPLP